MSKKNNLSVYELIDRLSKKNLGFKIFYFAMGLLLSAIAFNLFFEPYEVIPTGSGGLAYLISYIINYDETGVTVIYFYYTFHDDDGNHYEVEALGAAELSEAEIQNSSSGNMDYSISTPSVCSVCHGSGICQVCYGRGGMSYTTWGQGGDGWVECTGCHGDRSCQYCD